MIASRQSRQAHQGASYVELCLAILILAICLAPAARLLPNLLAGQRDIEARFQLSLIAQDKLDAAIVALDADFCASEQQGDLAARGHPDWRYHVVVLTAGGGRYATIRSTAWVDKNGDLDMDQDEPQVRFDTINSNSAWTQ